MCRAADSSKYFRESRGLRDNENRLFFTHFSKRLYRFLYMLRRAIYQDFNNCSVTEAIPEEDRRDCLLYVGV